MAKETGRFTIPGEAGFEMLTLTLAGRWGADVVRDSDGTELSEEILKTGMDVYSTICIIRGHNSWAKKNGGKCMEWRGFLEGSGCFGKTDSMGL